MNIYPAEIEGVLANHPLVRDVAVFGVPDEEFSEEVKAAVQLVPGSTRNDIIAEELIACCREHLAGYKSPVAQYRCGLSGQVSELRHLARLPFWPEPHCVVC